MASSERPLATQDREPGARSYRVNLPFVSAEFHAPRVSVPHVPMPNRRTIGDTVGAARDRLPSPGRIAFYGGLAAMAVLQLIEWPVAVALGVGTALASRGASNKPRDKEAAATERAAIDRAATDRAAIERAATDKAAVGEMVPAAGGKAATVKGAQATTPVQRAKRGTSAGRTSTT